VCRAALCYIDITDFSGSIYEGKNNDNKGTQNNRVQIEKKF